MRNNWRVSGNVCMNTCCWLFFFVFSWGFFCIENYIKSQSALFFRDYKMVKIKINLNAKQYYLKTTFFLVGKKIFFLKEIFMAYFACLIRPHHKNLFLATNMIAYKNLFNFKYCDLMFRKYFKSLSCFM